MLEIIKVIVGVLALTAVMSFAAYWWVGASLSEDSKVRRKAWAAETLLYLGMSALWFIALWKTHDRTLAIVSILVVPGIWFFRGARSLLRKRKRV